MHTWLQYLNLFHITRQVVHNKILNHIYILIPTSLPSSFMIPRNKNSQKKKNSDKIQSKYKD